MGRMRYFHRKRAQELKEANMSKKEKAVTKEFVDLRDGEGNIVETVIDQPFRDPIIQAMGSWRAWKTRIDFWLAGVGIVNGCDEVALMFTDEYLMWEFITAAVKEPGVKLFNAAEDHVKTSPLLSEYWVSYYFLEVEGLGMRVEVMHIDRGTSPLHATLSPLADNPTIVKSTFEPVVVHFSFKVPRDDYLETRAAMVSGGAELAQSCESDYGKFAYYRIADFGENLYIKPRINMRDPESEADAPLPNTDRGDFGFPGVGRAGRPITDSPQA